jgi:hypothetical protein
MIGLINVRFGPLCGPRSDISRAPRSARTAFVCGSKQPVGSLAVDADCHDRIESTTLATSALQLVAALHDPGRMTARKSLGQT